MSLRHRLTGLLFGFAAFAVLSASVTIYGIRLEVQSVTREYQQSADQTNEIQHARRMLDEQALQLAEIIDGRRIADETYFSIRDAFLTKLRRAGKLATRLNETAAAEDLFVCARQFEEEGERLLALVGSGDVASANELLKTRIDEALMAKIDGRLRSLEHALGESTDRALVGLVAATDQVLWLTWIVGVLAIALVFLGVFQIRRWLIRPLNELRCTVERLENGDYGAQAKLARDDELGQIGRALMRMARSVSASHARLAASEAKHRTLVENLRDAVVALDVQGRVIELHDSEHHVLAVEGEAAVGRDFLEVWPEWQEADPGFRAHVGSAILEGRRHYLTNVALKRPTNRGGEVFIDAEIFRVSSDRDCFAVMMIRDVTKRLELQTRLRHGETMEAVGALAGHMAHDFKNLLAGAMGMLSNLESSLSDPVQLEWVRKALTGCRQAATLARRLLGFARGTHGEPQMVNVTDVARAVLESLDEERCGGITLKRNLPEPLWVSIDHEQLTNAMVNLANNALHAMSPRGGELHVSAEGREMARPEMGGRPRSYVVLTVRDTGVGMTPQVRRRMFEPFFTTKRNDDERGHGLGMAMVYSTVRGAGGFIEVDSEPGVGTSVRLILPRCHEPAESDAIDAADSNGFGRRRPMPDDNQPASGQCTEISVSWAWPH